MRLAFQILGDPVGKGRGRAVRMGSTVRVVTPRTTREYEHLIAELGAFHAIAQKWPRGFDGPCEVKITAVFVRPAGRFRKIDSQGRMFRERGRIDCDNVAKAVLDGLQAGGVFRNDSQVQRLVVELWWTAIDESPCVEVEVETLPVPDSTSSTVPLLAVEEDTGAGNFHKRAVR